MRKGPTLHIFSSKEAAGKWAISRIHPKFPMIFLDEQSFADIKTEDIILHKSGSIGQTALGGLLTHKISVLGDSMIRNKLETFKSSYSLCPTIQQFHQDKSEHLREYFDTLDNMHFEDCKAALIKIGRCGVSGFEDALALKNAIKDIEPEASEPIKRKKYIKPIPKYKANGKQKRR